MLREPLGVHATGRHTSWEAEPDLGIQKSTTSQINTCQLGAFPMMAEEDED
jgi:hypothetical protein